MLGYNFAFLYFSTQDFTLTRYATLRLAKLCLDVTLLYLSELRFDLVSLTMLCWDITLLCFTALCSALLF